LLVWLFGYPGREICWCIHWLMPGVPGSAIQVCVKGE
jgi:hypothetical protein